ncbi:MAG: response regulator transcription factor [Alphaproteobacteria bacterium]|nr:response regulator transcription factor [Alphaproteobacteria bacterium]
MTDDPSSILVIEDEGQLQRLLQTSLEAHGYRAVVVGSGREALLRITASFPDVVLLDLGLPDMDGVELVTRVRQWSDTPILIVSSRDREEDKIAALDQGANDYVTKPFSMGELLARIRATLRQRMKRDGGDILYRSAGLEFDSQRREVRRNGEIVRLSRKEYELLRYFVLNADRVMTHEPALKAVWGPAQAHETQYLRVFVGRLRQKLERDPAQPELLVTESGVGYRLRTLPTT